MSAHEGGKKRVCLAHDSVLDRQVPLAVIKTGGLDEASRQRIAKEAQSVGRPGSHPHIVTLFDLGEHEEQRFLVTEAMGGGGVEVGLEHVEDGELHLEQTVSRVRKLE